MALPLVGLLAPVAGAVASVTSTVVRTVVSAVVRPIVAALRGVLSQIVRGFVQLGRDIGEHTERVVRGLREVREAWSQVRAPTVRITSTLDTRGLDGFIRGLPGALDAAVLEIAEYLAAEWRARVPVRTGAYRASIRVQTAGGGATVGTDLPYPVYLEYGTRYIAARPSFIPATMLAERAAPGIVRKHLGKLPGAR